MKSPILSYLERVHAEIADIRHGAPFSVGPRGVTVDPDDFGICLTTVDGYVYEVGATRKEFSLQSLSKPLSYGLVLGDLGAEVVNAKVDVEPSGDAFNEISLAPGTGRPPNAMINAGALAVVSLIKGSGGRSAIDRVVDTYSAAAGRELSISQQMFAAEMRHSDQNHALAYLLSSFGIIEGAPTAVLENYLRQCAVQVTCQDLAMMAATLANGGTNPRTEAQVLDVTAVEQVLSVMMTSGMYDDAGSWVTNVGMPAKSGVGGGTMAVLPGQGGIAVFSPPLDEHGSSVRGLAVCQRLSRDLEMHFVRSARSGRSAVRSSYSIAKTPSAIRRSEQAAEVLAEHREHAVVVEISGDLLFAGTESVVRELTDLADSVEIVVLDVRAVDQVSAMAQQMLSVVAEQLAALDRQLVLIDPEGQVSDALGEAAVPTFDTRANAVAYAEEQLLGRYGGPLIAPRSIQVVDSPALAALPPHSAAALAELMESRAYEDGDVIRRVGQRFGGIFFIVSGTVHTVATDSDGNRVRLSTLSAGMTFGELTLGAEDRQQTTQKADGPVEVMILSPEAIETLEQESPKLAVGLWRALTRDAYTRVDQFLREVAVRIRD